MTDVYRAAGYRCPSCPESPLREWFDSTELASVLEHANEAEKPKGLLGWLRALFS